MSKKFALSFVAKGCAVVLLGFLPVSFLSFAKDGTTGRAESIDGVSLVPPQGWTVHKNPSTGNLVMQHPTEKPDKADVKKVFFRPNITMTVFKHPSYIDEKGAEEVAVMLNRQYDNQGIKQRSIQKKVEFINYRGKEKALVMYSHVVLSDVPVTQLHIIVSGAQNTAIMTYSDLSDRFDTDKGNLSTAYASMVTAKVAGSAPSRYAGFLPYVMYGFCALITWFGFVALRRRMTHSVEDAPILLVEDEPEDAEEYETDEVDDVVGSEEYTAGEWVDSSDDHVAQDDPFIDMIPEVVYETAEAVGEESVQTHEPKTERHSPTMPLSDPFMWVAG